MDGREGRRGRRRPDGLDGRVAVGGERGPQALVARDELPGRTLQGGDVQRPLDGERAGDGVERAWTRELVDEPESLLGGRQRNPAVAGPVAGRNRCLDRSSPNRCAKAGAEALPGVSAGTGPPDARVFQLFRHASVFFHHSHGAEQGMTELRSNDRNIEVWSGPSRNVF